MPRRSLTPKLWGEQAEIAFMREASKRGFFLAKPFGDSLAYDFIVDASSYDWRGRLRGRPRLLRVQVKSSGVLGCRAYRVGMRGGTYQYRRRDFDMLAVWIRPLDVWYIIPMTHIPRLQRLAFYPHLKKSPGALERFRGRWDLLRRP